MLQTVDAAVILEWEEAAADWVTTAVCGSSFFCAAAEASAATTDADATADFPNSIRRRGKTSRRPFIGVHAGICSDAIHVFSSPFLLFPLPLFSFSAYRLHLSHIPRSRQ
mgnify:CR=1 FL=1